MRDVYVREFRGSPNLRSVRVPSEARHCRPVGLQRKLRYELQEQLVLLRQGSLTDGVPVMTAAISTRVLTKCGAGEPKPENIGLPRTGRDRPQRVDCRSKHQSTVETIDVPSSVGICLSLLVSSSRAPSAAGFRCECGLVLRSLRVVSETRWGKAPARARCVGAFDTTT